MVLLEDRAIVRLRRPANEIANATEVRGSLVRPAVQYFEAHGLAERYFAAVPAEHHGAIRTLIPSDWAPFDLFVQHVGACDCMALPRSVIDLIGRETGGMVNAAFLGATLRASRQLGATPWIALSNVDVMRERFFKGGAFAVTKEGPKEAVVDWYGMPVGRFAYFRDVFGAFMSFFMKPLCQTALVRALDKPRDCASLSYRISWV